MLIDRTRVISTAIRVGTVVFTTMLSFVVMPPVLMPEQYSSLSWKNIFVFCAGIFWIIADRRTNDVKLARRSSTILLVLFLGLITIYEYLYQNYSITCYDRIRVVTTRAAMSPDGVMKYRYWQLHSPEPMQDLIASNGCSALAIWQFSDIAIPYYGLLILYLSITFVFIVLIILISELVFIDHTKSKDKR